MTGYARMLFTKSSQQLQPTRMSPNDDGSSFTSFRPAGDEGDAFNIFEQLDGRHGSIRMDVQHLCYGWYNHTSSQ